MKKCNDLKLPPLWLERWQNVDPFWHVFHLQGKIYREQPGRKTLRFIEDNEPYFVKCHFGVGWREIVKNLLQGRLPVIGAKNEYLAIQRLEKYGFVPTVVGYGWRGINPATLQSFLITKELSFTVSLEDFCRVWPITPPKLAIKWALIRKVANIARTMHKEGVNHRDFYLCHFLLDITGGCELLNPHELMIYIIDLHRAQTRKCVPKRWRVKDIAGLYFSAMDMGLTKRDYLRFMLAYNKDAPRRFWKAVEKRAIKLYRKEWRKLPHNIRLPFYLTLNFASPHSGNSHFFVGKQVLRALPDKRMTVRGEWQQQEIIAKLFISKHHALREIRGHTILAKEGFDTPILHHHGYSQHDALYVLLYQYQNKAQSFATIFREANESDKKMWLEKLLSLIKQLHEKGLWQEDIHFNNFLIEDGRIIIIDVGTVHAQSWRLSKRKSDKNIATLFAQLPITQDKLWLEHASARIQRLVKWKRKKLEKKYLAKVLRNCSAYLCEKHHAYQIMLQRAYDTPELRQFIQNLIHHASDNETHLTTTLNGQILFIQRFKPRTWRDYFVTPGRKTWLRLHKMCCAQHSTTMPIALIETRRWGFKTWSCIIIPHAT